MSSNWEIVPLGAVANVIMGQSPRAETLNSVSKGYPFLQGCAEFGEQHPDTDIYCFPTIKFAPPQSILISVRAPVGAMNIADQGYAIGRGLSAINGKPNTISNQFLRYAIETNIDVLHRKSQGSTFLAISSKELASLAIAMPSPETQQYIANVVSTVDALIATAKASILKFQQLKSGMLHDLFTRGLLPSGQLRPKYTENPSLYKKSALGWIPKEWDILPLAKRVRHDITYGIVQAGVHVDGGIPYIRTGDMGGDRLQRDGLWCTTPRIANLYSRSRIRTGEIVMAIRATVGKVLQVPPELDGANLTQGTARIAPDDNNDPSFLLWNLRSERIKRSIGYFIKGTTFSEITLQNLRSLPVVAPIDLSEQKRIAAPLNAIEAKIQCTIGELAKLKMQKHGLMQDLLTGRIRISNSPLLTD